ncbi:MAG TPA: GGDEF domain-containing protein [Polyangia bacterium]|jgi:diguanylate cyclase (GGDEF)-like protein|nr:GGDEF domain-containing protein [Polyangia bacterium]
MKPATAKKTGTRQRPEEELEGQLVRLSRQNAVLRKEIARLQAYRAMAYRDPLTALWNRRFFEERLKEEISRSQRAGSSRKFSVMIIDVNDFKGINDTHGHQTGDRLLKWVGAFLTDHLRTHDVPCRTGGDEFSVLLPDLSSDDCGGIMSRLRDQLAAANVSSDIPVSLSLGTASWPDEGTSAELLIASADQAMYADKRRQKAAKTVGAPVAAASERMIPDRSVSSA